MSRPFRGGRRPRTAEDTAAQRANAFRVIIDNARACVSVGLSDSDCSAPLELDPSVPDYDVLLQQRRQAEQTRLDWYGVFPGSNISVLAEAFERFSLMRTSHFH